MFRFAKAYGNAMDKISHARFAHDIPTLIHPLPTLRQGKKVLDGKLFNNKNISNNLSPLKTVQEINLFFAPSGPVIGGHLRSTIRTLRQRLF